MKNRLQMANEKFQMRNGKLLCSARTQKLNKDRQECLSYVIRYFKEEQNEMPDPEIESKVKQIIVDELGVDENEVTPNARFIDDLGADSLDTVELVMRFEEEFGIEIPDEDAEKIQSVRDAYNYIDQHKK